MIIGDFYGDPEVALIDAEERWCAVAGCGLIIYFLKNPYTPYQYDQHTEQYFEAGRTQADLWWVTAIEQTGPFSIRVSCDNGVQHQLSFSQYAVRGMLCLSPQPPKPIPLVHLCQHRLY